jgi:hypothetical protein
MCLAGLGYVLYKRLRMDSTLPVGIQTARAFLLDGGSAEESNAELIRAAHLSVCIQIMKGPEWLAKKMLPKFDGVRALGVPVAAWGYHLFGNEYEAREEGRAAAETCLDIGAPAFLANIEEPYDRSNNPPRDVRAFAETFLSITNGSVELHNNGKLGDDRLPDDVEQLFGVRAPMIYGTKHNADTATVRRTITARWEWQAAEAARLGQRFTPDLWCSTTDADGTHRDYQQDKGGELGQVSRVAKYQPDAVWFWYWNDDARRRAIGTRSRSGVNMGIAELAHVMRAAKEAGPAWPGFGQQEIS